MTTIFRVVPLLLLSIVVLLAFNAARLSGRQISVEAMNVSAPDPAAAQRLAQAIRIRSISGDGTQAPDTEAFSRLHDLLARSYPATGRTLQREVVAGHSLLYEWRGSDPTLAPVLLMAHLDVVPADPASLALWTHAPFSGAIADGYVWGRGALDDKSAVMALHEAVEALLGQGYRPQRTVYLAFGHDEEVGGSGSARIAAELARRGVRLYSVLDEGQAVTVGIVPGFSQPVALIGIAEKGYLSLELTVEAEGGHSSMPPPQTAVGILAAALARLEGDPFPTRLVAPVRSQLSFLGAEQGWLRRLLFANLWLFAPLVEAQMANSLSTNALVRTTLAPTVFEGGVKDNVLPARARAIVNLRLLPGTSAAEARDRVQAVIADPRVSIGPTGALRSEPSAVSDIDAAAFAHLHRAIKAVFPDAVVAPSLVLAATDSRHFAPVADHVLRFRPVRLETADLARYHGVDERLALTDYAAFVAFYIDYIRRVSGPPVQPGGG
jgi:carboxypeptidase PM20D1